MCGEADNEDKIFMKSHINLVLDCDFKKNVNWLQSGKMKRLNSSENIY